MTERDIFANFISQYRKPFDINVVMLVTGCDRALAKVLMKEASGLGKIKCLRRGCKPIYVRVNRYGVYNCANSRSLWNTNPEAEAQIRRLLAQNQYSSGRKLAQDLGKSHEFVYKCLNDLCQQGLVSRCGRRYQLCPPVAR